MELLKNLEISIIFCVSLTTYHIHHDVTKDEKGASHLLHFKKQAKITEDVEDGQIASTKEDGFQRFLIPAVVKI